MLPSSQEFLGMFANFIPLLKPYVKDGKLTGAAQKLLDQDPELKKSFQNINKANKKALDAICKKYPSLDSCK